MSRPGASPNMAAPALAAALTALLALTALFALTCRAPRAHAGGFEIAEQSAAAGGTGGAGVARTEDPGAAWYNPAALVDGGGLRLGAGLVAAAPVVRADAMDGSWSAETRSGPTPLPSLMASWSRGDLAAGASVGVPFGASVVWPDSWPGRYEVESSRLVVVRVAPFLGWRRGRFHLAGGVHVDAGQLRLSRALDFVDEQGDVALDLRGTGVGVDASAFARVLDDPDRGRLDLGLAYKSRTHLGLRGEADFTAPEEFTGVASDQDATTSLTLPDLVTAGMAYRRGTWTALLDVGLAAWQVHDRVEVDFEDQRTPDVVQTDDWHTALSVRAGLEWRRGRLVTRAGLYRDGSPAPRAHLSPSEPDSNRLGGSVGLGWSLSPHLALDAFYGYLALESRASDNPDSMPARYGGHAQMLGLGLRYQR